MDTKSKALENKKVGDKKHEVAKKMEKGYHSLISKTPMKFSQMSKNRQYHVRSVEEAEKRKKED